MGKQIGNKIMKCYLNGICSSNLFHNKIRKILYKIAGLNIGQASIHSECFIGGNNLTIGDGTFVNHRCFFDTSAPICIKEKCNIAYEVTFCTSSHTIGNSEKRAGENIAKSITVNKGCWIGARVTILPGVTIGEGCIIAAGSVVSEDCEPNSLYAGVPAKKVKDLV